MVASYNHLQMSDYSISEVDAAPPEHEMRRARLVGFSVRDRELLRLFLRRPPRAGVSLTVVEDDAEVDLLIANTATPDAAEALRAWTGARPAIGIVERFERDARYYQIAQDGQMLFALAQAINRIRSGWTAPNTAAPVVVPEHLALNEATTANSGSPDDVQSSLEVATADVAAVAPEWPTQGAAVPSASELVNSKTPGTLSPVDAMAHKGLPWQRALDILVIDDSNFSRAAISEALVKVGFSVNTVENGPDGIKLASAKRFDVALVDFEMPGMQGPEVLRKLRALGGKAPTLLIMLTSRTGPVDRLRAKFAGCDAYLTKPTKMQDFLKILRDFAVAGKLSRS